MTRAFRALRHVPEFALAAIFFILWLIAEAGRSGAGVPGSDYGVHLDRLIIWILPFALLSTSIALARIAPWVAHACILATVVLGAITPMLALGSTSWPAYLAVAFTVGIAGSSVSRRVRWVSLALGVLYAAAIVWLMFWRYFDSVSGGFTSWAGIGVSSEGVPESIVAAQDLQVATYVSVEFGIVSAILIAIAWLIGFSNRAVIDRFRSMRAQAETERALSTVETRLAVADERGRIARDLHDILAHSLTVVVAQAEGLQSTRSRSEQQVDESLDVIADAARSALGDIRLVVEGLRAGEGEAGAPLLADVTGIIDTMTTQGLTVDRTDFGDPGVLGAGAQIAVFRIVQEALTNALAHGGVGSVVRLGFDWRGSGLAITIVSTPGGAGGLDRPGNGGNGIRGMKERATIVGGWLTAGADDSEGANDFRVTGFVPYPSATTGPAAATSSVAPATGAATDGLAA